MCSCCTPRVALISALISICTFLLYQRSDQHPHPFPLNVLPPNPPQQQSRRMIQRQLSLPHPFPLNVLPPHPPQQQSRRIIHRQEDIPFPLSHPHPQFVAVKSLMLNPPFRFIYSFILCVRRKSVPYGRRKFSSCENGLHGQACISCSTFSRPQPDSVPGIFMQDSLSLSFTSTFVISGYFDRRQARAPDTTGVAIEVPLFII